EEMRKGAVTRAGRDVDGPNEEERGTRVQPIRRTQRAQPVAPAPPLAAAPKVESKPEARAEPTVEARHEPKPQPRQNIRFEQKPKPAHRAKPEPNAELKPEPNAELKPELKHEPKLEPKPEARHEVRFGAYDPPPLGDGPGLDSRPPRRSLPVAAIAAAAVVVLALGGFAARKFLFVPATVATTGTLIVSTNPAGAQVYVDGLSRGVTPLTLSLNPGPHS